MCRKILITGAILVAGLVVMNKLAPGFVGTAWTGICKEARNKIPTRFELDRLENEIAQLDRDIEQLAGPIAEADYDLKQLKKDITKISANLERGKKALTAWTNDLDRGSPVIHYEGKDYNQRQMKQKVQETFTTCKLLETQLNSKEQLLAATQQRHDALYEQANQIAALKKQFEIEVANLRAEEEKLKVAKMGNTPVKENARVAQIKEGIRNLQKQMAVAQTTRELLNRAPFNTEPNTTNNVNTTPEPNLEEIRHFLQGNGDQKNLQTIENRE